MGDGRWGGGLGTILRHGFGWCHRRGLESHLSSSIVFSSSPKEGCGSRFVAGEASGDRFPVQARWLRGVVGHGSPEVAGAGEAADAGGEGAWVEE